jgi:hypothetical protein
MSDEKKQEQVLSALKDLLKKDLNKTFARLHGLEPSPEDDKTSLENGPPAQAEERGKQPSPGMTIWKRGD